MFVFIGIFIHSVEKFYTYVVDGKYQVRLSILSCQQTAQLINLDQGEAKAIFPVRDPVVLGHAM